MDGDEMMWTIIVVAFLVVVGLGSYSQEQTKSQIAAAYGQCLNENKARPIEEAKVYCNLIKEAAK